MLPELERALLSMFRGLLIPESYDTAAYPSVFLPIIAVLPT